MVKKKQMLIQTLEVCNHAEYCNYQRDGQLELTIQKLTAHGKNRLFDFAVSLLTSVQPQVINVHPIVLQLLELTGLHWTENNVHHLGKHVVYSMEAERLVVKNNIETSHLCISTPNTLLNKEGDFCRALWDGAYLGLQTLPKGSQFVTTVHELYQRGSQILLWVLFRSFDKVSIQKPSSSNLTDTRKYIVCLGFKPHIFNSKYRDKSFCTSPMLLADDCPKYWFVYITSIQNVFTKMSEQWKRKSVDVYQLLLKHDITNENHPKILALKAHIATNAKVQQSAELILTTATLALR